jgi:hypothetical protein
LLASRLRAYAREAKIVKVQPGLAFSLIFDLGFAVGLMTHKSQQMGDLVWLAVPVFDEEPTAEQVRSIEEWRWPIFFPLSAAVRQKVVTPIAVVPIPSALRDFPVMRSGANQLGWRTFTEIDGKRRDLGVAKDSSLPPGLLVNDTALKEMLVTGWQPEKMWYP